MNVKDKEDIKLKSAQQLQQDKNNVNQETNATQDKKKNVKHNVNDKTK